MSGTMQTKLFKTVCKRAGLMRAPYRQSSWTNNISPTKKKLSSQSKIKSNVRTKSMESNNNNKKLINKKLVLPFSRRLILIDRPFEKTNQNAVHIDKNIYGDYQSQQSELSSSTSQYYLSSDDEHNSEHNNSYVSISSPPSPFLCDPYESYDWEC
ncbi:unnamed protein product [Rotaria sp. Silwood2]|nr:unnamed protein product [Rotaria sp. Silwood2]CAF4237779.1 unnamed protein product [Rotaria sp. Silwood2]